ncbi:ClpP family protease [Polluticaenibacter yanchengensis]|uniref:ATP-dependent Clp protease proteolytic subunit n=1 Tax=Polluticaenibacter yanchengensis TaxID=3014562 RepID=A0ABT4UHU1_9BACT|nr:ATP-dependent Clp protease proteolytic subunit [Chitinophagaceae bacterium LY-5]
MEFGKEFERYAVKHRGISSNTLDSYMKHSAPKAVQSVPGFGGVPNITSLTPNIIEERPMNIAVMDVYSRLMMDRIIFLGYPITDEVANIVTAQLLFLESTERTRDIQMYINSPGGSVYAGLGMYDTMQFITPDVSTICTGIAASMGAVLMAAGTEGKRTALQHSRIMIHQPSAGAMGQASDIEITVNEVRKLKQELYDILAYHSGQTAEQIAIDSNRDKWLTAPEAKEYGLVDEVLITNPRKAKK